VFSHDAGFVAGDVGQRWSEEMDVVHTEFRYCSDRWTVEHIGGVEEAVLLVSSQC
jgi:hypothetical protein